MHFSRLSTLLAGAVAASVAFGASSVRAEQFVNVLTGGTSGVYYPLGVALSKIYGDKIPDVSTQVKAIFRRVVICKPDRLAAMLPPTPDARTWVVLTGRPYTSASRFAAASRLGTTMET